MVEVPIRSRSGTVKGFASLPYAHSLPAATDALTREAFRDALDALKPGWQLTDRGLTGPGGALVRLSQRHESRSEGHVDVQFILDEASPSGTELWDCVSGFGASPAERARSAAHLWATTTAGALLELKYSLRGEFADHYHGADPGGFPGWHVICGAILGFGKGDSPGRLQRWWLDHAVLPALSHALGDTLDESTCPHGVKILFGGQEVAEVRVDGDRHEAASDALASLPWPRLEPAGFVRSYVLVLHREGG